MRVDLNEKITVPETVSVNFVGDELSMKGPKGEDKRSFVNPKINISVSGRDIVLDVKAASKREKRMISTFLAHIKNMIRGVQTPFEYKLKGFIRTGSFFESFIFYCFLFIDMFILVKYFPIYSYLLLYNL